MAQSIHLLQWNGNGLRAHHNEFRALLASPDFHVDIICLEETFLKPGINYYLPGYQVIRKDRIGQNVAGGGLLMKIFNSP